MGGGLFLLEAPAHENAKADFDEMSKYASESIVAILFEISEVISPRLLSISQFRKM